MSVEHALNKAKSNVKKGELLEAQNYINQFYKFFLKM